MKPNPVLLFTGILISLYYQGAIAKSDSNQKNFLAPELRGESSLYSPPAQTYVWYYDGDHDGFGDPSNFISDSIAPAGYVTDNTDCNDADGSVHPGATEICNHIDDNCDGQTDEGLQTVFYADNDQDGYGNPSLSISDCSAPAGYVNNSSDCNDTDVSTHPGAEEICNHLDDNCDGQADEGLQTVFYVDNDHDGYGNPSLSTNDCSAPAGYVSNNTDCNDSDVNTHPGAAEICNHLDDNCDGQTDEGVQTVFYADNDHDGYGNPSSSLMDCSAPSGYVANNTDCDDSHASSHPGGTEICNGLDDDCSGIADDNIVSQASIAWQKTFGGTDADQAESIQPTLDGGYIIAGKASSINGDVTNNHGKSDVWIVKIDANGTLLWQKTYGGAGDESANMIRPLSDGSYIVAGATNSAGGDVTGNHGATDFWVLKIGSTGNLIWQKTYGGSGEDVAYAIAPAIDRGFIVVGYTQSSDGNLTGNHSSGDYWIVKIDTNGNLLWQKTYGGSGFDFAYNIGQASDGGYITSGYARSNDGDVIGNHGQEDFWILKLDSVGNLLWQKSYGGTGGEGPNSSQATSDGGYILAGVTHSYNIDVVGNHGVHDFWVLKLDHSGNIQWKECLGGTGTDNGNAVQQTTDGGYIVTGLSDSNDDDVTGNHGRHDYWVVKLNASGSIEWQKSFGGTLDDEPYGILQSPDGQYIVAGLTNSKNGDVTGNHGSSDFWVVKVQPPAINTYYLDADGDSYGNPNIFITSCFAPAGYVDNSSDCNDSNPNVNPAATEICNGIDDDCNSYTDENAVVATISPLETITICNTSTLTLTSNSGPTYTYQWVRNGNNISGATNSTYLAKSGGTYSVVIHDGTCSSNSPATVIKITNQLAAVKPAGTVTVCDGTSVVLNVTASPGIALQWKNANGNISGATNPNYVATSGGSYYVTEKDITGCTFNSSTSTVQMNTSPSATLSASGSLNICATGSVVLSVSATQGATYQWYKDNVAISGATSTSYTATVAGSYKVLVTAPSGCTKFSSLKTVKGCKVDDANSNVGAISLACYPNPTDGNFTLKLDLQNSFSGTATLKICNLLGQIIATRDLAVTDGALLEKTSFPDQSMSGLYLLKLTVDGQDYSAPLLLSK